MDITHIETDTKIYVDGEELSGRLILRDEKSVPTTLFLHGAGKATKERSLPLATELVKRGISSMAFDFSGHGASTGLLETSSLTKRIREARAALDAGNFKGRVSLCAFSMGGHVALEMLRYVDIRSLILFYPAVYSNAVVDLAFGNPTFTAMIRQEKSWASATVLDLLDAFNGNLCLIIGENDEVIPAGVVDLIDRHSQNARRKSIIRVSNAPHLLLPTLYTRPALFEDLCNTIAEYISDI